MIQPRFLKPNDRVAVVAPGKKLSTEIIHAAAAIIRKWSFEVALGSHLFSDAHQYLSGTDSERLSDFQSAIDDDDVRAIICARGGYGTTRILDKLNFDRLRKHPKWIVGFSDITALHLKLSSLDYMSVHGTMPVLFSENASANSVTSLFRALTGKPDRIQFERDESNRHGTASGQLIGGNLSLIVDSLGTPSEIETAGKILVVEEVDEYLYKIDRMFTQLLRAGKLDSLSGLIIGHFAGLQDTSPGFGESLQNIVMNKVSDKGFPVAFGFPSGHDNPNLAWIVGAQSTLSVAENSSLSYEPSV